MTRLIRPELHDLVWAHPVARIAQVLGVSGNAVSKTCKIYNIPTPGRGYWARVQAGEMIPRIELPNPEDRSEVPVELPEGGADELERLRELGVAKLAKPSPANGAAGAVKSRARTGKETPAVHGSDKAQMPNAGVTVAAAELYAAEALPSSRCADVGYVLTAAQRQGELDAIRRFADRLVEAASSRDPKTRAVTLLLREHLEREISRIEPLTEMTEMCRRVAAGAETPEWWASWGFSR